MSNPSTTKMPESDSSFSSSEVHERDSSASSPSTSKMHESDEDFMSGDDEVIKFYGNCRLSRPLPNPDINPEKAQRRAATYAVESRRTTKGMLRKALQIYDLEGDYSMLSSDDVSALQRIFGVEDVKMPHEHEYRMLMADKIHVALQSLLRMYG